MHPHTRLLFIAIGFSGLSCVIAIVAVIFALSRTSAPTTAASQTAVPTKPLVLTPENPASALPHAVAISFSGGTVKAADEGKIILETNGTTQTIALSSKTKIYKKGAQKDPAIWNKELDDFRATLRNAVGATDVFLAPEPFETTEVKLGDISVGSRVSVRTDGAPSPSAVMIYLVSK